MTSQKFSKAERIRKSKALIFTIIFHILLIGGLTFGSGLGEKVTDTLKDWFGEETTVVASDER